jgi:hypothetical protein
MSLPAGHADERCCEHADQAKRCKFASHGKRVQLLRGIHRCYCYIDSLKILATRLQSCGGVQAAVQASMRVHDEGTRQAFSVSVTSVNCMGSAALHEEARRSASGTLFPSAV